MKFGDLRPQSPVTLPAALGTHIWLPGAERQGEGSSKDGRGWWLGCEVSVSQGSSRESERLCELGRRQLCLIGDAP